MEINMKPKWILDKNSPEGIKECEVMKVEPEICGFSFITDLCGYDYRAELRCIKYELIYKTTPCLQTIKCINRGTLQDNSLVWVKEVFDTKEEALRALKVKEEPKEQT